ncbi:murein biosynthesis integral membrane protein MurJ [Propioniciclava sp. MC1595]|uniref:murein biosynthesis integral membrane protein MurJ n=1 Tax=Propioniciclava sp. MC1595 TaxID=2760308 RepID=UPI0016622892|nr:murein biosynthesis integral membrane protein MurJ [Propioniciclava sp. MC1595]MBB1495060.1 murein biosynthesis integral membrane protein MurJ [Propioniciclava sp. MC1595]QTE26241.1 murein biosynthesis integral membrane protein MurJ [Propioniciclava sp. MC1595]
MADGTDRTPQAASRRLLNATALMAAGTLISRVLGFVKAGLLVIALGATTAQADTYSVATVVPNTLYMLVAGGALNTVLVPQIVRHAKNDADGGEAFINRIMTAFLVLLVAVTALFTLVTPLVMSLWTEGSWRAAENAGHWEQLVFMAFLTMPQLFFYGAFFLIGQVLNARDNFGPMMWAPILNNIVAISVLGIFLAVWGTNTNPDVPFSDQQVLLLGLGSTLGIIVQTLALVPAMRRIGFRYRPRWDLKGQGLGETFHLAKWMLGYVLLTTVVQIVNTRLGSGATMGGDGTESGAGVTAYNTAYLVWLLPHSLLTVSLATAMLPSASRLAAAHDMPGVAAETTRTLRLALTFLVPAAVGFLVLGVPFSRLAFGHGAAEGGWVAIGWTLVALALALVPYTIQYVYLRGFYALEDTRTPFLIQLVISVVNVGAAFLFVGLGSDPMTVAPRLALAYGLSYLVGAWLTHRALKGRLPQMAGGEIVRHTVQLLVAVLPGAVLAGLLAWWSNGRGYAVVLGAFVGAVALVLLTFFFVAKRLHIRETTELASVLRRRGGGAATAAPDDAAPVSAGDAVEATAERTESALLEYPEPGRPTPVAGGVYAGPHNAPGHILDQRYRLDEALNRRGSTVTWRGWDLNLSRPVLLHVMDPNEGRVLQILDQARQAAPAVDARYLRVWDAVLDESGDHGSYIVCEYAPGQSLELALRQGAFTDVEAAWVVREVAAGLVAMHAQGLHHRQLNPDTVVVTASGNVKIVGFLVEYALHPTPAADEDPEKADVRALGELLYAGLTGHWPGPARYGLRAAPTDSKGRPVVPRQVNKKVSLELSDIVDRILSPIPRGRATRLETASDIAVALSAILGSVDGSHLLEARLRYPIEHVRITAPKPPRTDLLASPLAAGAFGATQLSEPVGATEVDPDDATAAHDPFAAPSEPLAGLAPLEDDLSADDEPTGALHSRADDRPASPWGPASPTDEVHDPDAEISTQAFWLDDVDDVEDAPPAAPFTPIPPPRSAVTVSQQAPSQDPPRRWQALLLGLFALVLVASLVGVFVNQFTKSRAVPPTPDAPYALVSARDFDPAGDGGDGVENPDQARYVMDGDPTTAWTTERYGRSANFNGRKPGAGVVVDLGEVKEVSWVTVDVGPGPTTADIRVPADPMATEPPMESESQWRRIDGFTASTGAVQVKLDATIETRWLLVYLTAMPRDGANYVGSIHEIRVSP